MTAGEGWSGLMHNGDPADTQQPDCCADGGGGGYCTVTGMQTCYFCGVFAHWRRHFQELCAK